MIRAFLGYGLIAYLALLIAVRPWHRNWGSYDYERVEALPGDELSASPIRAGDRAIAIDAPVDEVWPWLVQIGQDRGGFYSYAWLENAFGVHIRNAGTIEPEWQGLREGDFVRATQATWAGGVFGDRIGWPVDHVDAGRVIALRYWVFDLEATSHVTSRLHIRTHEGDPPVAAAPLIFMLFEPAHFIMERGMLRGIKARAEAQYRAGDARSFRAAGAPSARYEGRMATRHGHSDAP